MQGAQHAGMQGVRVHRKGDPWERFGDDPDLTVESIDEFRAALED